MRALLPLGLVFFGACTTTNLSAISVGDASVSGNADAGSELGASDANSGTDAGRVVKDPNGTTAPPAATPTAPTPAFDCEAHVVIDQLKPTTCAVVDPVSHRVGHLQWICAGGAARLTLGNLVLTGTVTGHAVSLNACREDPVSWLAGHYETVSVELDLAVKKGALSFERATGHACPKVYTDCSGTAAVVLEP